MKTIDSDAYNEIVINKSKFITNLIKIDSVLDAQNKLNIIKNKYADATHNCYAYIVDNYKKMSDDGEPGGTAGMPILNVLESNQLRNILCIVTRYFGGIKLGAGGLVRAYTSSVTSTLDKCLIRDLKKVIIITINFNYENVKNIDFILKDSNILLKEFNEYIKYKVIIDYDDYNLIKEKLNILVTILNEEKTMFI